MYYKLEADQLRDKTFGELETFSVVVINLTSTVDLSISIPVRYLDMCTTNSYDMIFFPPFGSGTLYSMYGLTLLSTPPFCAGALNNWFSVKYR